MQINGSNRLHLGVGDEQNRDNEVIVTKRGQLQRSPSANIPRTKVHLSEVYNCKSTNQPHHDHHLYRLPCLGSLNLRPYYHLLPSLRS